MNRFVERFPKSMIRVGLVLLGLVVLTACGSLVTPEPVDAGPKRFDYVASISIEASDVQIEVEALHDATVVVWRPEAGFAILGFSEGEGSLALMNTGDPNQDVIETPEVEAGGWTAWGGGWTAWGGGWTAWSGGWTAWSGGWTAWSGGWTAWSGGVDSRSTFGENLLAWNDIKLPQGQLLASNLGSGVKVAVIDTGLSLTHPALAGNLAPSSEWQDFIDGDSYPMDEPGGASTGHGTAVAGIILQVAPQATILPIRVLAADGSGDVDHVVQGIDHAVQMGADVINLSLGTDTDVAALQAMVDYATSQEIFVISSLGNAGNSDVTFPARYAKNSGNTGHYLIGVGSVGKGKKKSSFSNYGTSAELFAPRRSHLQRRSGRHLGLTGESHHRHLVRRADGFRRRRSRPGRGPDGFAAGVDPHHADADRRRPRGEQPGVLGAAGQRPVERGGVSRQPWDTAPRHRFGRPCWWRTWPRRAAPCSSWIGSSCSVSA